MTLDQLNSIQQLDDLLSGTQPIAFGIVTSKDERYEFIEKLLKRFTYRRLKRLEKGIVIRFLVKVSGYSPQQITRLIQQYTSTGEVKRHQKTPNGFTVFSTEDDRRLLAELDRRHDTPNGFRVKKLCKRAY